MEELKKRITTVELRNAIEKIGGKRYIEPSLTFNANIFEVDDTSHQVKKMIGVWKHNNLVAFIDRNELENYLTHQLAINNAAKNRKPLIISTIIDHQYYTIVNPNKIETRTFFRRRLLTQNAGEISAIRNAKQQQVLSPIENGIAGRISSNINDYYLLREKN